MVEIAEPECPVPPTGFAGFPSNSVRAPDSCFCECFTHIFLMPYTTFYRSGLIWKRHSARSSVHCCCGVPQGLHRGAQRVKAGARRCYKAPTSIKILWSPKFKKSDWFSSSGSRFHHPCVSLVAAHFAQFSKTLKIVPPRHFYIYKRSKRGENTKQLKQSVTFLWRFAALLY